ncbi:MAG TPA: TolC family protein [Bacteroidia bacterium]|nr:TolC family protein [Bacteroidia bacterium]
MKKFKLFTLFASFVFFAKAQNQAEFTLQAAIDYALKHNATYLNTEADADYNRYKRNEIMGQGLPQINAAFDVKDNAILPTSLIPASAFNPLAPKGTFFAAKFGVQYNSTASVTASQLIFNSNYIVGLQASKELMNLSQKNILRSKVETAQNVSKAYYGVLVNRERIKILDLNIDRVKTLKENTTALNQNGFVEKIDLDRLEVSYNNLLTEREKTARLLELTEVVLKFQMGYELSQPITLTDNLDKAANAEELQNLALNDKPDVSKRPEFLIIQSQQKLNEYDLKRYRLNYLPTIGAYGTFAQQFQSNTLDFNSKSWYPFAIIGATLNIGIFDGLQTNARIQQAKINLLKTRNSSNQLKQSMEMEAQSAAIAYKNAALSLQMQKKNIELAKNIFEVVKKKYEQGIGSSLELNTSENDLHQAETNYYNSLYDLIIAKIDYQKSTGTLVK